MLHCNCSSLRNGSLTIFYQFCDFMNAIEAKAWFSQAWPGRPDAAPKPFFKSARSNASHMAEGRQNDGRIALILHTSDGCPWPLTMSAGTEIFIGHYRSEEHTSELQSLMRSSYAG